MKTAAYIVALLAVYAVTQRQDAADAEYTKNLESVVAKCQDAADAEYTKNLESVVAKCLSNPVGQPITIGNEIYLCGIYNTGEKIARNE